MPGLSVDPAVHRFVDAAARLSGDQWDAAYDRLLREWRSGRRDLAKGIGRAASAAEFSMLQKFVRDALVERIMSVSDDKPGRLSDTLGLADDGAIALQKRDKVGMEVVRSWFEVFEVFEGTPVVLDEILADAG